MAEKTYDNASQERGYAVLLTLAGQEITGLAPSEIADAVKASRSRITCDLRVLQKMGLAEPILETGRWRLGPKVVQIALAFTDSITRSRRKLDEISQRYTRQPN